MYIQYLHSCVHPLLFEMGKVDDDGSVALCRGQIYVYTAPCGEASTYAYPNPNGKCMNTRKKHYNMQQKKRGEACMPCGFLLFYVTHSHTHIHWAEKRTIEHTYGRKKREAWLPKISLLTTLLLLHDARIHPSIPSIIPSYPSPPRHRCDD